MHVFTTIFTSWQQSVHAVLTASGLQQALAGQERLLIKPNLVEALQPPITTPVELVAALVDWLAVAAPRCEITIGEGCGAKHESTWQVFEALGYGRLARQRGLKLIDLNEEPLTRCTNPACRRFPEIYLPSVIFDTFLLSVPVLKAHSLAGVTLTMKNMMGLAPPRHYQQGGHWKKASFHRGVQEAIFDLNCYRTADFTLLDASVGMAEAHLWGPTCSPPVQRLCAAFDPVAIDAHGCALLGRDWREIGHIRLADGVLGSAIQEEHKVTDAG